MTTRKTGTTATPDRGRKFGTKVREVHMATSGTARGRYGYGYGKSSVNDIENDDAIDGKPYTGDYHIADDAHDPAERSQEQHLRDVAQGGKSRR